MFDFINNNFSDSFSEIIKEELYLEEQKNKENDTGLHKVKVLFDQNKYQVLKLTLDINNVSENIKKLLPFFKKEIKCKYCFMFCEKKREKKC